MAEILATALRLYASYPLLFLALSLAVVAPYDLVILAVARSSPLGGESASASTVLILTFVALALVAPLVSALQVHALITVGEGGRPQLLDVLRRGLRVLPVVVAAEIIAWIGIGIGLVLFVVPGIILALRWAVVPQVAAVEGTDWPTALKRSAILASRNYLRIFGLFLLVSLVTVTLSDLAGAIAGTSTHAPQVILGIAVDTITQSFKALALAVLYFDLRAREHQLG